MSSLAHEGNPKEDTITISGGSVLSTATISINFPFFGGTPPNIPPEGGVLPYSGGGACLDVFQGGHLNNVIQDPNHIPQYSPGDYVNDSIYHDGIAQAGVARENRFIKCTSMRECFGFAFTEHPGIQETAGQSTNHNYPSGFVSTRIGNIFSVTGYPRFAVLALVKEGSTPYNCTMFGCIYYQETQTWDVRYWSAEPMVAGVTDNSKAGSSITPGGTSLESGTFADFGIGALGSDIDAQLVFSAGHEDTFSYTGIRAKPQTGPGTPTSAFPDGVFQNGGGGIAVFPTQEIATLTFGYHVKNVRPYE